VAASRIAARVSSPSARLRFVGVLTA